MGNNTGVIIFDRELLETNGKGFSSESQREYYETRFPIAKQFFSQKNAQLFDTWELAKKIRLVDLCVGFLTSISGRELVKPKSTKISNTEMGIVK